MVEVSVILLNDTEESLESVLNQTLTDIEVISKIPVDDERAVQIKEGPGEFLNEALEIASGKYIYFYAPGDELDLNLLEKSVETISKNDIDFVSFISDESRQEPDFGSAVFDLSKLNVDVFGLDLDISTKLITSGFIKENRIVFEEFRLNEFIFMWEVLFRNARFMVLDERLIKKSSRKNKINIEDHICAYNIISQRFEDYNLLKDFKSEIYDYKVKSLHDVFSQISGEYARMDAYDDLKNDFTKMIYKKRFVDFSMNIDPKNKMFFDDVVYSKNYNEFEKLIDKYSIKEELSNIRLENKKLEKEIRDLKKQIKVQKKIKRDILNSSSWKVTEPLRKVKK